MNRTKQCTHQFVPFHKTKNPVSGASVPKYICIDCGYTIDMGLKKTTPKSK